MGSATSTVFPSDAITREYLASYGRKDDWTEILVDKGATYDLHEEIDLSQLEPLISKPSSPGQVVSVSEVAGEPLYQAYIGSSANPGYRDFVITAMMVKGRRVHPQVSFDINPSSRNILEELVDEGYLADIMDEVEAVLNPKTIKTIGLFEELPEPTSTEDMIIQGTGSFQKLWKASDVTPRGCKNKVFTWKLVGIN